MWRRNEGHERITIRTRNEGRERIMRVGGGGGGGGVKVTWLVCLQPTPGYQSRRAMTCYEGVSASTSLSLSCSA